MADLLMAVEQKGWRCFLTQRWWMPERGIGEGMELPRSGLSLLLSTSAWWRRDAR